MEHSGEWMLRSAMRYIGAHLWRDMGASHLSSSFAAGLGGNAMTTVLIIYLSLPWLFVFAVWIKAIAVGDVI